MSIAKRFMEYAGAFEQTYADDDWKRLESFFTEDAVYSSAGGPPLGGRSEGRQQVLDQLKDSVNALDRRFDNRSVALIGSPDIGEDTFFIRWRATYKKAGCPDLAFDGSERATFSEDSIRLLEDEVEDGGDVRIQEYLAKYFDAEAD